MKKRKLWTLLFALLIMGSLIFALPTPALAQDTDPPPEETEEPGASDEDILIFEPQLFLEFPFNQGFKIKLNFGIVFEVPRRLTLFENNILNFFLRFKSSVRPAETAAPTVPEPTATPTPEPTPTPTPEPTAAPEE
jgi:hypothetical protein